MATKFKPLTKRDLVQLHGLLTRFKEQQPDTRLWRHWHLRYERALADIWEAIEAEPKPRKRAVK